MRHRCAARPHVFGHEVCNTIPSARSAKNTGPLVCPLARVLFSALLTERTPKVGHPESSAEVANEPAVRSTMRSSSRRCIRRGVAHSCKRSLLRPFAGLPRSGPRACTSANPFHSPLNDDEDEEALVAKLIRHEKLHFQLQHVPEVWKDRAKYFSEEVCQEFQLPEEGSASVTRLTVFDLPSCMLGQGGMPGCNKKPDHTTVVSLDFPQWCDKYSFFGFVKQFMRGVRCLSDCLGGI